MQMEAHGAGFVTYQAPTATQPDTDEDSLMQIGDAPESGPVVFDARQSAQFLEMANAKPAGPTERMRKAMAAHKRLVTSS